MDLRKLNRMDVISFGNDEKERVLECFKCDNRSFIFVAAIKPSTKGLMEKFKIWEILDDGKLTKVVEPSLMQKIIPIIEEKNKGRYDRNPALAINIKKWLENVTPTSKNSSSSHGDGTQPMTQFNDCKKSTSINENVRPNVYTGKKYLDDFHYSYFLTCLDLLVKWLKKEDYCPLDIISITVWLTNKHDSYSSELFLDALIADEQSEIDNVAWMANLRPGGADSIFYGKAMDYFNVGKHPLFGISSSMYMNQDFRVWTTSRHELEEFMREIEKIIVRRYPGTEISVHIPGVKKDGPAKNDKGDGCGLIMWFILGLCIAAIIS